MPGMAQKDVGRQITHRPSPFALRRRLIPRRRRGRPAWDRISASLGVPAPTRIVREPGFSRHVSARAPLARRHDSRSPSGSPSRLPRRLTAWPAGLAGWGQSFPPSCRRRVPAVGVEEGRPHRRHGGNSARRSIAKSRAVLSRTSSSTGSHSGSTYRRRKSAARSRVTVDTCPVLRGRSSSVLVPFVEAGDEQERLVGSDELGRDAPVVPVELPAPAVDRHPLGAAYGGRHTRHDVRDQAHRPRRAARSAALNALGPLEEVRPVVHVVPVTAWKCL